MVSVWPEPPNAKSAGARCGVWGTFAVDGTEFVACSSGAEIRRMSVFRSLADTAATEDHISALVLHQKESVRWEYYGRLSLALLWE